MAVRYSFGTVPILEAGAKVTLAAIVRTPSNTWKAVVRKIGWPTTIKTFRTKRDAKDWARNTEDEMVRGVYLRRGASSRLTLAHAFDRYERDISPIKSEGTRYRERWRIAPLKDKLGDYSLAAITPDLVAAYRDERLEAGKSPSTVRLEIVLLGHRFNVATREWGLGLAYNPVANVRKPSPGNGRNRRLAPDEEKQLFEILDAHTNPMLGWVVRTALLTGMRQGEILSLRKKQVDLERRVVRLDKTKNGDSRVVPLSREAVAVFQTALDHPMRKSVRTQLVFFGEPGKDKRRRPYRIGKVWSQAVKRAGLEDLRFHDLRHEAVSRFVEAGLADQQVAAISGHKSMQMLKRYTHLRGEDLVDQLDRVLG